MDTDTWRYFVFNNLKISELEMTKLVQNLSPFRASSSGLCYETAFDFHVGNLQEYENLNQHILTPNNTLSS